MLLEMAVMRNQSIVLMQAGRERGPPDGCGGPRAYAERRRDAVSWDMATDMCHRSPSSALVRANWADSCSD